MRQRTLFSLMFVPVILSGCLGWRRVPDTGLDASRISSERPVRLRLHDGSTLVLAQPMVVGDSIVGTVGETRARVAVATSSVRSLDVRHRSGWRSAGVVVLFVAGTAVLLTIVLTAALVGNLGA